MSVSVLILTKNEDINIAECLESLSFSDDIVLLDSFSTDRTVEIAQAFPNVRVLQREFDTEWKQRNFGLHETKFKHDWVYICDADERVPPELGREIVQVACDPDTTHCAYRLRYKNMYLGCWIRHATSYPVWILRLVRPDRVNYEMRETNVHPIVDGSIGELSEHFIHYSFNGGLRRWYQKHNYYSTREAIEGVKARQGPAPSIGSVFQSDPMQRRRAIKNWSYRLRARALFRLFISFFLNSGWLDGLAGLRYCLMISMYESWIEIKINEMEAEARRAPSLPKLIGDIQPAPIQRPPLVEVLIPTFNEASRIAETVKNALNLGPVFVLDSFSTDDTVRLAEQAGARVFKHRFENYSKQKNWGLQNLPFESPWVLILDADEKITAALAAEIVATLSVDTTTDGTFINRQLIWMGSRIRHGGLYPSWNLRLFRHGRAWYEDRSVHEHMICTGPTKSLKNVLLHVRDEQIAEFIEKHIHYADLESDEWLRQRLQPETVVPTRKLFQKHLRLRQWMRRRIWPRIPFRPLLRWVYMYLFRFGFLDGRAGWRLAWLMANYEYMISTLYQDKLYAVRSAGAARPQAAAAAGPVHDTKPA
ncbi:MAG TPA: glycosyltransferase family 2 protein [Tepidisphaeraceae bacterium]|jgi:glycosyltransferase involved in cell wall biosynthesis